MFKLFSFQKVSPVMRNHCRTWMSIWREKKIANVYCLNLETEWKRSKQTIPLSWKHSKRDDNARINKERDTTENLYFQTISMGNGRSATVVPGDKRTDKRTVQFLSSDFYTLLLKYNILALKVQRPIKKGWHCNPIAKLFKTFLLW